MKTEETRNIEEVEASARRIVETLRSVALMLKDRGDDISHVSALVAPNSALQIARLKSWNSVITTALGAIDVIEAVRTGAGELMDVRVDRFVTQCDVALEGIKAAQYERTPGLTTQLWDELVSHGVMTDSVAPTDPELELFCLAGLVNESPGLGSLSASGQAEILRIAGRLSMNVRRLFQDQYLTPSKRQSTHEKTE
jgi:hypothetical protein